MKNALLSSRHCFQILALLGERFSSLGLTNRNIRKQTFITPIAVQPEDVEIGIVQNADGYLITVFRHDNTPIFMFLEQSLSK